jgi:hypothetical protein
VIRDNARGIHLFGSWHGNAIVTQNDFLRNNTAVLTAFPNEDSGHFYHNNFIDNVNAVISFPFPNEFDPRLKWDNGYPEGGNYWSEWTGPDQLSGPNQDLPGADGIVDHPYELDSYPFAAANGWVSRNIPPVASAGPDLTGFPGSVYPGEVFVLDATDSFDPDGVIVQYEWQLEEGVVHVDNASGSTDGVFDGRTQHVYYEAGLSHQVILTVIDDAGAAAEDTVTVTVMNPLGGAAGIRHLVEAYELEYGVETALTAKLNAAHRHLLSGDIPAAREALQAFVNQLAARGFCLQQTPPDACEALTREVARLLAYL